MAKKIILTRKIQLLINSGDKAYIYQQFETLFDWQRHCRRAANLIYTHCFLQDQMKDMLYVAENIKVKLCNISKDENGIFTTSRGNASYQILSDHYKGIMPMSILSCLNRTLTGLYNKEKADYYKGVRSLRNYKRDIPMPFAASDLRHLSYDERWKNFTFNLFGIPFRTYLGKEVLAKDIQSKRDLLHQVIGGEIKLCGSSLVLDAGKIYLLAVLEVPQEIHDLDANVVVEAALSIEIPIVAQVGASKYSIGNKEEFLHRRLAIQAAIERTKRGASYNRSGNGRKRKLKNLDRYKEAEFQYAAQKIHVYSKRLIGICIKHGAATLILTNHGEAQEDMHGNGFLLRNWSYASLKDKIMYKANKAGIKVILE